MLLCLVITIFTFYVPVFCIYCLYRKKFKYLSLKIIFLFCLFSQLQFYLRGSDIISPKKDLLIAPIKRDLMKG